MITKIKISGFKTFRDFEMPFSPFTVIVGINASGKSNLFDALQLLARLAESDLKTAFSEQRGEAMELFTQYGEDWYADEIGFMVEMLIDRQIRDNWGGETELKYTRLRYELKIQRRKNERNLEDLFVASEKLEPLRHDEDVWVKRFIPKDQLDHWRPTVTTGKRGIPSIYREERNGIPTVIVQDGADKKREFSATTATQTVLSAFNSIDFPHVFAAREEMRSWKLLQLNPQDLRTPTRQDLGIRDTITTSGENLAAALHRLKIHDEYALKEISRRLNNLLPNLTEVEVYDDKANHQFIIKIRNEDGREFSSRVLSEGTLRLLTLCLLQFDEAHKGLICFEEPENGIHPFRLQAMVELLKDLSVDFTHTDMPLRQVIVNTHSPVLVGEVFNLNADNSTKVWLAQLITRITEVEAKKIKLYLTQMLPLERDKSQLEFQFSEQERKWTLREVKKYLESADFEKTIDTLK